MKIIIAGGSGQVGQILARAFQKESNEVVILTRSSEANLTGRPVIWDARTLGAWVAELDAADVVINLVGKSVNCRYTARNREEIIRSRIDSTKVIGEAISQVARSPRLWLQAATGTIYRHRYDAANDEDSAIPGENDENVPETWRFSTGVAKAWEHAFNDGPTLPRTRKVLLRISLILSPDRGGVFDVLLGLVRRGLGGRVGNGRQYVSWIHDLDFVRAILWLIEDEAFSGAVNLASPNPVPNAQFMAALREAWGIRIGMPAPEWMLEIGTFFMRTETELVLKSRRVVPGRLLKSGFEFQFPQWSDAARDLCGRWRRGEELRVES